MRTCFRLLFFACALMIVAGCQKESAPDPAIPLDEQLLDLTNQAWERMAAETLFPENPSLGIVMQNDGIAADFLVDETYMEEDQSQYGGNPENRIAIRDNSFLRCLRGLALSSDQLIQVREQLLFYDACKDRAVSRAREIYRDLRTEYQAKFQRLLAAYRNGTLTEREFKSKVSELRAGFRAELLRLHLWEKLDAALKQCLWDCLSGLHSVLTDRQWSAFVECCRSR